MNTSESAPDHSKEPTTIDIKHNDMPELADSKIGDHVHIHLHGKVTAIRAADKYTPDGSTQIKVHKLHGAEPDGDGVIEGDGPEPSAEEAKSMPLDKLRNRLAHKEKE